MTDITSNITMNSQEYITMKSQELMKIRKELMDAIEANIDDRDMGLSSYDVVTEKIRLAAESFAIRYKYLGEKV